MCLCWKIALELTRLLIADVDIETQDDDVGEESSPPVDDEHYHAAQYSSSERNPHVVVFEAGTPPWGAKDSKLQQFNKGHLKMTVLVTI